MSVNARTAQCLLNSLHARSTAASAAAIHISEPENELVPDVQPIIMDFVCCNSNYLATARRIV